MVINAPIVLIASTIMALSLVQGITHISARLTAVKKKNDTADMSR